jgi:hypothetical protein
VRRLSEKEIEIFANRPDCKRLEVQMFLLSMGRDSKRALYSLALDATRYDWNMATIEAIRDGIVFAKGGEWKRLEERLSELVVQDELMRRLGV